MKTIVDKKSEIDKQIHIPHCLPSVDLGLGYAQWVTAG